MSAKQHEQSPETAARVALAIRAGDEAGRLALALYQHPALDVVVKGDGSPVTKADKEGELLVRSFIEREFPRDGVLGEEFPEKAGASGYRWIIDPIDGTRAFTRGQPTWGVLIGLEHEGEIVGGFAGFPALGEALWAGRGQGATWRTRAQGERAAKVSQRAGLHESAVETLWPHYFEKQGLWDVYTTLSRSAQRTRSWSDAFSFALVATGRSDAAIGFGGSLWDVAPFIAITREAGGRFTNWAGGYSFEGRTHLAAPMPMHGELVKMLHGSSPRSAGA